MKTMLAIFCLMAIAGTVNAATEGDPIGRPFYRYGYYLFLADPTHGCEACYVPLLITSEPLEQIARSQTKVQGVWIITYERDSIWQMDGTVDLVSGTIEAPARKVRVKGRNYRYQQAPAADVLKLLQHPVGTLPISRPFIVNTIAPGGSLEELISNFRTLLRVRERSGGPGAFVKEGAETKKADSNFTSILTVLDDGNVEYRVVSDCFDRSRWSCPPSALEKVFHYALTTQQFAEFRNLLERQEIREVADFLNAAPISNDYDIEIPRPEGVQRVQILAWMPNHLELEQHPALIYLVCKAKEIEHRASGTQEMPDWCKALPPLK
jgi:hypothetical protein